MFVKVKRLLVRGALLSAPVLLLAALAFPRLGSWLVVQDPLAKSDAIIVLGGTLFERPLEALDLYKEGWAPRVYLFRQITDWGEATLIERKIPYTREVDIQVDLLARLGLSKADIVVLDQADSTAEESEHVRDTVTRERLSRVIIVTSKQHTRRARLVMRRALQNTGATVIVRYSRYDRSDVDYWWRNRGTLRFTLFETQRLLAYWVGLAD